MSLWGTMYRRECWRRHCPRRMSCLPLRFLPGIEDYRAIKKAGHKILPKADANFESEKYRKTCPRFFKLMCATSLGKLCASDHAMNATDEMSTLNRDIKEFFDESSAIYPVWKELEKACGAYLK